MNVFKIISYIDTFTTIELVKDPTPSEQIILDDLINRKNGYKFDSTNKVFTIMRKIDEQKLELLFKENNLPFVSRETKYNLKKAANSLGINKMKDIENSINEKIITFGKYRGTAFNDLPLNYLKWLKENHFDKQIKMIAEQVITKKETVYITL